MSLKNKENQQSWHQSEERLHLVIENLTEGLVISELNGQIIHWNRAGLEMHGLDSHQDSLLKVAEFEKVFELSTFDGSILPLEQWPLPRIIAGEQLCDVEVQIRRLDKDWKRVFSYGGAIVADPNRRPLAFLTITDITSRKLAEAQLRSKQEELAAMIGSAIDAFITVDENERVTLFNTAAERMFLVPVANAIGESLDRFIPERFRTAFRKEIHILATSDARAGKLELSFGLRADGAEFPIEGSVVRIESNGQNLYTLILRDITERKRAADILKEQARILDLAPILIRDLSGRIILWNTGAEQMYGWKSEEAVDKLSHVLFKTEFPRPLEEIKARLLADGHWEGELIKTHKDGRTLVIASNWVLHRDEDGKPKAVLEVNNDITERKQAEQEIRRLAAELEQRVSDRTAELQAANTELEAFSYSVSHDLRAPLRAIDGFSLILLEDYRGKLDAEGLRVMNVIRNNTKQMGRLVDDLLAFSRLGRKSIDTSPIDMKQMASEVFKQVSSTNDETISFDLGALPMVEGDQAMMRQVLTNLLSNAIKYSATRERIVIEMKGYAENGENIFYVKDNGVGFDMAYANKLFGVFQRLHGADEFEGTGVGLAIVQRIVARHGGRVWAAAEPDQGATFYFALPRHGGSHEFTS